ncbi:MAG: hypothetical protein JWM02_1425 [Frankiales bacterium]|nr:hypothetical protein [Frankiales bacterium]
MRDENGYPITNEWPISVCPVCESNDATARVSAIISAGTVETETRGNAFAVGGGQDAQHHPMGHGSAFVASSHRSVSTTQIAQRLQQIPRGPEGVGGFYALAFVATLIVTALGAIPLIGPAAGWIVALAVAAMAMVPVKLRLARTGEIFRAFAGMKMWKVAHESLRASYYCSRDDVVFGPSPPMPERIGWAAPNEWIRVTFAVAAKHAEDIGREAHEEYLAPRRSHRKPE